MSMAAKSMNMDFLCVLCASEASAFWIRDAVSFDGDRKFPPTLREPISGFVAFRRITPFGGIRVACSGQSQAAGEMWISSPSARSTFMMVSKLGLPSGDNAL